MACYDFDHTIQLLRQAIDFAEIEGDFVPLRRWAKEVERSGHELGTMDSGLNLSAGQKFLLATLQMVATGSLSPENALRSICYWLVSGRLQKVEAELTQQYRDA